MNAVDHEALAVEVARGIVAGTVGLVEGCRELTRIFHAMRDADVALFGVFVGVDGDCHGFPLGDVRDHWDAAALAEKDAERAAYEARMRDAVHDACKRLLAAFLH